AEGGGDGRAGRGGGGADGETGAGHGERQRIRRPAPGRRCEDRNANRSGTGDISRENARGELSRADEARCPGHAVCADARGRREVAAGDSEGEVRATTGD